MARILVVDDDPFYREFMKSVLEKVGHRVKVAEDGREALEILDGSTFDAVVADILMPNFNGAELIEEIYRRTEGLLPIVAISSGGSGDPQVVLRSIEHLGVTASLEKPVEPELLSYTVRRVLDVDLRRSRTNLTGF